MNEIFGTDIKLGKNGEALVAANGELLLTAGVETGLQDIGLAIKTPIENLFYDVEFGSRIHQWIKEENTELNRIGFSSEVKRVLRTDPRVETGSETCSILKWDENSLNAIAGWCWIDENHINNLVITLDNKNMEIIVEDVNPDGKAL